MIYGVLVAQITHAPLEDDEGNALFKWMNMVMTNGNFERHVRARNYLNFDHVQVFSIEKFTEIGVSEHGNTLVKDIWGAVLEPTDESTVIVKKPIERIEDVDSYRFPLLDDFGYDNVKMWILKKLGC